MPLEETDNHSSHLSVDLSHSLHAFEAAHSGKRSKKEFAQLNRWFEIALNNMGRGLSMFDAEHRLIMCNASYREMYGLSEEATRRGTTFDDIMRCHAAMDSDGAAEEAQEGVGDWIAGLRERLSGGKAFTDPIQLKDGRTIFVRVGPIAGGGWVDAAVEPKTAIELENTILTRARQLRIDTARP